MESPSIRPIDAATKYIWDLIRHKVLNPGDRINESRIANDLGVSQGVVREVLHRLAEQGIVEITPFKGSRLVSLTSEDLDQIIKIRQLLEPHAIALARERVTEEDYRDLHEILEQMRRAHDVHLFDERHLRFHRRLWEISHNRQLVRILQHLTTSLFGFYEVLRKPDGKPPEDNGASHQLLINALKGEGDPEQLIREHLSQVRLSRDS